MKERKRLRGAWSETRWPDLAPPRPRRASDRDVEFSRTVRRRIGILSRARCPPSTGRPPGVRPSERADRAISCFAGEQHEGFQQARKTILNARVFPQRWHQGAEDVVVGRVNEPGERRAQVAKGARPQAFVMLEHVCGFPGGFSAIERTYVAANQRHKRICGCLLLGIEVEATARRRSSPNSRASYRRNRPRRSVDG